MENVITDDDVGAAPDAPEQERATTAFARLGLGPGAMQAIARLPESGRGLRMLFDSNLQPMTAGIRGSVSARQFLYETDDYYIDLRLEPRRETDRACLVGQILTRRETQRPAEGFVVRLQKGKRSIAETSANQFGEFQLEFDGASDLCVSIGSKEGDESNEILLPLYGVHVKSLETRSLD